MWGWHKHAWISNLLADGITMGSILVTSVTESSKSGKVSSVNRSKHAGNW